jgi:hypothetical protein
LTTPLGLPALLGYNWHSVYLGLEVLLVERKG